MGGSEGYVCSPGGGVLEAVASRSLPPSWEQQPMLCWLLQMSAGLGIQVGLSPKGGAYTCVQNLEIWQSTAGSRESPRFW